MQIGMKRMQNEAGVWTRLQRLLSGPDVTHLERVECSIPPGLPDVHYIIKEIPGWIELKDVDRPKRGMTQIRIDHFTKQQRIWLYQYGISRGKSFVLVHIEDTCYLFDWRHTLVLGTMPEFEMKTESRIWWPDASALAYREHIINILSSKIEGELIGSFKKFIV